MHLIKVHARMMQEDEAEMREEEEKHRRMRRWTWSNIESKSTLTNRTSCEGYLALVVCTLHGTSANQRCLLPVHFGSRRSCAAAINAREVGSGPTGSCHVIRADIRGDRTSLMQTVGVHT